MQHDILDEPERVSNLPPIEINRLCSFGFLVSVFSIFLRLPIGYSDGYSLLTNISSLLIFGIFPIIAFVGIFHMKRNFFYFYYFIQLLKLAFFLNEGSINRDTLFFYALPALVSIAVFSNWRKMT